MNARQEIPDGLAVLGALLIDNDAIDRVGDLRAEHFYRYDHRLIFECITKLIVSSRRADALTVLEWLRSSGKSEEVGGLPYLNNLAQNAMGSANIGRYAEIVVSRWKLRGVISVADTMGADAFSPMGKSVNDIIGNAQQGLESLIDKGSKDAVFIGSFLTPIIERIDEEFHGSSTKTKALPTGLRDLDSKLGGGMRPGQLIIIAGRPAMGKTAIALSVAEAAAEDGEPTLIFSQEMEGEELCARALSRASGLSLEKVLDGAKFGRADEDPDWTMLTKGVSKVSEMGLIVDDRAAISLGEIQSRARAVKRKNGLGLIVVDYLGLMAASEGDNRTQQVGANSRGLKALAKQMGVPVVLLAQLSRKCDDRTDKRPMMSDLRDSGEIEQDADIIIFLYRDEVYHPDSTDRGIAEINVAKQRNGPIGIVAAKYVGERTTFQDLAIGTQFGSRPEAKKTSRGFA
jgi:replicative DNA helicase